MKTLVVILMLVSFSFSSYAQRITELEETRIAFSPSPIILTETDNPDEYSYNVSDSFAAEFTKNPMAFMESYFDISNFIEEVKYKDYDSYLVRFHSSKGFLEANYSKEGVLNRTRQLFKDIALPLAVRNELWRQTEGWSMVNNSYKARGQGKLLDKELYRIKVVKNNKSKIIKIDPKNIEQERVAGM
ncbi:hypothetical protein [Salegentibacter salegens]|uniref:Beta-lactamase-inhibitor-like, PepSY-like n=1 Tax=Salegentibacter salegens TaxID=143223 RepID=A0A1M7K0Y3_9FLAO|nr:hypothetical protein [Salegentibacter salegens]PRX42976.1 hypothetical protein LY58_02582 [Salegentibacter salegens]SHM58875.1 hypothetical protein SAMN05878281_1195 [Salegentibacter salegens]